MSIVSNTLDAAQDVKTSVAGAGFGSTLSNIGSAVSALATLAQTGYNIYNSDRNYKLQVAQNAQNLDLYRESLEREDNAVQRRAADLEAAGLSKTLAAGASASTMSPIQLKAAQHDDIKLQVAEALQQSQAFAMGIESLKQAKAETRVAENEANNIDKKNELLNEEIKQAKEETKQAEQGSESRELTLKSERLNKNKAWLYTDKAFKTLGQLLGGAAQGLGAFSSYQRGKLNQNIIKKFYK